MAQWDAAQYLRFEAERTQPSIDLAARIPLERPAKVLDVGCGPGNSTAVLARRFPEAAILGVDNAPPMIEAAKKAYPHLSFALCDAAGAELEELGADFDVVFSNACIQWIPDHPALLARLLARLQPGGVLAVQTPMNYEEPIHRIIGEVCGRREWRDKIGTPRIFYNLTPGEYADHLARLAADYTLWQTTYYHRLESHEAILDWYRGTGLRPYLQALSEADRPAFEKAVYDEVAAAYPRQENGEILFRFPRLFFLAVR